MGRSTSGTDAYPGGSANEQPEHDATVGDFYLDEFEVTVGRFRRFVDHFNGTPPPDGAAAHPLIAGSGWQSTWNTTLASSQAELIGNLDCGSYYPYSAWRDTASGTEELPINCVSWYEAFAFCAWDGGRLPTEAEWEYAAAGGNENRLYPWGSAAPNDSLATYECRYAGSAACGFDDIMPVGALPAGAGRWGHKDLAGNVVEWTLDQYDESWYGGAGNACSNCACVMNGADRVLRGGSWSGDADYLRAAMRYRYDAADRGSGAIGFRCARSP